MNFTIYSIGDSEFLEQILIALAMITQTNDFGAMVSLGLLVGVFSTIVSAIAKGGQGIEFQHVLLGYILWGTMFVPTTTVNIEDSYTGQVRVVANVPIGPAAAGGIISLVGYKVTELFEVAYGPIIPRVTETEFAESLKIISDIRNKASGSTVWRAMNADAGGGHVDLHRSWLNYIKDCSLKKIEIGLMTNNELVTQQVEVALKFDSTLFGTQIYTESSDADGQNLNCSEAWSDLNGKTKFLSNSVAALNAMLGLDSNKLNAGESSLTKTNNAINSLLGSSIDSQMYMKVAVLDPILLKAAASKHGQLQNIAGATMINQAIQQRNTTWAAEQTLFMSVVRPMLAFFEAFTYAIAPIMAFVMVLGAKGIQLAGKYFTMLIWIQLWMPLLAIVNLYIYTVASRKMETYAAMTGHNWDSFYALNSSADIMQNWIATGGMLASSTPAIALMLIYGSAVTATHLAGRLKSDDTLNEKQVTPDLRGGAPLLNESSAYTGDATGGARQTGTEGTESGINIASAASSNTASTSTRQQQTASTFSTNAATQSTSTESGGISSALNQVGGQTIGSSQTELGKAVNTEGESLASNYTDSEQKTNAIKGVLGFQATAGVNASAGLATDKIAQILGKEGVAKGGGMDALRARVNGAMQNLGVKSPPGKGVAVAPQHNDGGSESPAASGPGIKAGLVGGVKVTGGMESSELNADTRKHDSSSSKGSSTQWSKEQQAALRQELSQGITGTEGQEYRETAAETNSEGVLSSAQEHTASTKSFQSAKAITNSLGQSGNFNPQQMAGKINGRSADGSQTNTGARQRLDQGLSTMPPQVKKAANDKSYQLEEYNKWSEEEAKTGGAVAALLNQANYVDPKTGEFDQENFDRGQSIVADTLGLANGQSVTAPTGSHDNSGITGPSGDYGDLKQNNDINPVDSTPLDDARNISGSSVKAAMAPGALDGSTVTADHGEKIQNAEQTHNENQSSAHAKQELPARHEINEGSERSVAGLAFGAADNIGAKAEAIAGGAGAALNAQNAYMGDFHEAYQAMSPDEKQELKQGLALAEQGQDDMLFDQFGAAGLPIKGAQMLGNQIIGAVMDGADHFNGGGNMREGAEGLSTQERGAYYASGMAEAASQGTEAYSSYMQEYGGEVKASMGQQAQDNHNLTANQAAVFTETYDSNPVSMNAAVQNLKGEYAMRDDDNQPMKNDDGTWKLSEQNEKFTDNMVERLQEAPGLGDQSASHLQPIGNYNQRTGRS